MRMGKAKSQSFVRFLFYLFCGFALFGMAYSLFPENFVIIRASAGTEELETMTEEEFEKRAERQAEALEAYQVLYLNFLTDESGMPAYPDEYAGAYIEEEGNLHIMLTNLEGNTRKELEELLAEWAHKLIYEQADYSYKELEETTAFVWELGNDLDLYACGVDEKNNQAFVELKETDIETLKERLAEADRTDLPIEIKAGSPALAAGDFIQPEQEETVKQEEVIGQETGDGQEKPVEQESASEQEISTQQKQSEEGNQKKEGEQKEENSLTEKNETKTKKLFRTGTIVFILIVLALAGIGSIIIVKKRKKRGV